MTSEIDRLKSYHNFSPETLDTVAEVAERYRAYKSWPEMYADFQSEHSHASLRHVRFAPLGGLLTEIVDIVPDDYDNTLLYHLPMGNAADPNMLTRLMVLSSTLPNTRIITESNPAQPLTNSGRLTSMQRAQVKNNNFRPTIEAILQYTHSQRVDSVTQTGPSYGADRSVAGHNIAYSYDINSTHVAPMDPASPETISVIELAKRFLSTNTHLSDYVNATECAAYLDARVEASRRTGGMAGYAMGLLRLSNLAILQGIAGGNFESRLQKSLERDPNSTATVIWGSESELAIDSLMSTIVSGIQDRGYQERVVGVPIIGQHHAMFDDIFLNAALVREYSQAK